MPSRRKNMLEAFQASRASSTEERTQTPKNDAAVFAGESAGPFADLGPRSSAIDPQQKLKEVEKARRVLDRGEEDELANYGAPSLPPMDEEPVGWNPRLFSPLGAMIVLGLFVLAFLLGSMGSRETLAASNRKVEELEGELMANGMGRLEGPRSNTGGSDEGSSSMTYQGAGGPLGVQEAMLDPANRFTLKLISYGIGSAAQELSEDTYQYLSELGFPVARVSTGEAIIIYAGATPKGEGLDALLEKLRELPGPPPRSRPGEFRDAFVVNLDDAIDR